MDKSIYITIGAMMIIAGSFIGFKAITKKECVQPVVTFDPPNPEPGQMVKFSCTSENGNQVNWDFGDSTSSTGKETMHAFTKEGSFVVKANLFENCETEIAVNVITARTMTTVQPAVVLPGEIHAGDVVSFSDQTYEATSWKWTVKETGETGEGQNFNATFPKPGNFTLLLSVNGEFIKGDSTINLTVLKPAAVKKVVAAPDPDQLRRAAEARAKAKAEAEERARARAAAAAKAREEAETASKAKAPRYMMNPEFSTFFIETANTLHDGESNASDDWIKIVAQTCINETMLVEMTDETGQVLPALKLEAFKKKQLLTNYCKVISVKEISRASTNCIKEIKIKIEKNK